MYRKHYTRTTYIIRKTRSLEQNMRRISGYFLTLLGISF